MFGVLDGWEETTGRRYGSEVERGEEAADENLRKKIRNIKTQFLLLQCGRYISSGNESIGLKTSSHVDSYIK